MADLHHYHVDEKLSSTPLMDGLLPDQFYQQELSAMSCYNSEADLSSVSLDLAAKTTGHKYWTHIMHKTLFRRIAGDSPEHNPTLTDVHTAVSFVIG